MSQWNTKAVKVALVMTALALTILGAASSYGCLGGLSVLKVAGSLVLAICAVSRLCFSQGRPSLRKGLALNERGDSWHAYVGSRYEVSPSRSDCYIRWIERHLNHPYIFCVEPTSPRLDGQIRAHSRFWKEVANDPEVSKRYAVVVLCSQGRSVTPLFVSDADLKRYCQLESSTPIKLFVLQLAFDNATFGKVIIPSSLQELENSIRNHLTQSMPSV